MAQDNSTKCKQQKSVSECDLLDQNMTTFKNLLLNGNHDIDAKKNLRKRNFNEELPKISPPSSPMSLISTHSVGNPFDSPPPLQRI